MRRRTPAELFSSAASRVSSTLRKSAAAHELCQDSIAAYCGVGQTTVAKWMSSQRDDTPPLARVAMMPREVIVDIARGVLAEHHAVVVDMMTFGEDGESSDGDLYREMDAAQLGAAHTVHTILVAAADRVISSSEATTVRSAIRAVVEPLMAIDRRMERIELHGPEGVGRAH